MRTETNEAEPCCDSLALPIQLCHRVDVASFHYEKENMNLWCCCCGRFWRGTDEELKNAEKRAEEE